MRQFLFPLLLTGLAIALFVMYTNPTYQRAKVVLAEVNSYNDALNKSKELKKIRDEKLAAYKTFSPENINRLRSILPDNVDNIHLIIDINNIAARRGLALKDVSLGTISDSSTSRGALAVGSSGEAVGSVELGFTVSASYDNMLAFITDLEHSLRVMDVENMDFSVGNGKVDLTDYKFKVRTFWLH